MSLHIAPAEQSCQIFAFPPSRRVGQIRQVALELTRRKSARAADIYRGRIADRLFAQLAAAGLSEPEQDEAVGAFFDAIDAEIESLEDVCPHCRCRSGHGE